MYVGVKREDITVSAPAPHLEPNTVPGSAAAPVSASTPASADGDYMF
jgi:hypothetical protein